MYQAHIRFPQTDGTFRYWRYNGDLYDVPSAQAIFDGYAEQVKIDLTTTTEPKLDPGNIRFKVRGSVVVNPGTGPLVGEPRTRLGTKNGSTIIAGTGLNYLIEQYKSSPDTWAPKGGNLEGIVFDQGITLPAGLVDTDYSGQAPPADFVKPQGYRLRFFGGKADQKYYEHSNEADEVPEETGGGGGDPLPPIGSVGSSAMVRANSENMPIVIENNGTKWRWRKTGGESIKVLFVNGIQKDNPGGYDYLPGDQLSIIALFNGDANPQDSNTFTYKAYYLITFGDIN